MGFGLFPRLFPPTPIPLWFPSCSFRAHVWRFTYHRTAFYATLLHTFTDHGRGRMLIELHGLVLLMDTCVTDCNWLFSPL